jgi:hypothetical protein
MVHVEPHYSRCVTGRNKNACCLGDGIRLGSGGNLTACFVIVDDHATPRKQAKVEFSVGEILIV